MMSMSLYAAIPEIFLVGMILLIMLLDAFAAKANLLTLMTVIALIGAYFLQHRIYTPDTTQFAFNNMFILDSIACGMKLAVYLVSIVLVVYSRQYILDKKIAVGAFYIIFLFAVLGMQVLISANTMLVLYLGLELLSLALYGLIALSRDNPRATEAAMKFFVLGALGSGILLYGISFIYGATGGAISIDGVAQAVLNSAKSGINHDFLVFGLVFIVAGLMFKLGLVPFHMWVPDVYEGSSMAVTAIISTVTKIAAVIFVFRFLIEAFALLSKEWAAMLLILACLSLIVGNLVAIAQTNIKRMLGYSTIAHMGFIAFGFMTRSSEGLFAVMFYLIIYVLTSLAVFGVLLFLSKDGYECEKIEDLAGLNKTHPIYAAIMLVAMFSLAGIPPLVGFYAKFKILEALIHVGYIKTAIFAVMLSLIGVFYYLRIIKVMYFDVNEKNLQANSGNCVDQGVLILNGALILILGIVPGAAIEFCYRLIMS